VGEAGVSGLGRKCTLLSALAESHCAGLEDVGLQKMLLLLGVVVGFKGVCH